MRQVRYLTIITFPSAIFDALVTHSWRTPVLFSAALPDSQLMRKLLGIEIGFHGIEYRADCGAQSGMGRAAGFRHC